MILLAVGLCCGLSARAGYNEDYNSMFGAGVGASVVRQSEDLGVHWARLAVDVTPNYVTNMTPAFLLFDMTLTNFQAHGVVAYGNINPACNASSNWPTPAQFAVIVSNMVERYDGDGVSDMPGLLYPIRVWELVNEFSSMAPTNQYPLLGQSNFIAMIISGRQAIKAAYPDAVFALDPFNTDDTQALFQQMNPTNVDLVAFHSYSPIDAPNVTNNPGYLGNLADLMQTLNLTNQPVWATEYAFYDHLGATRTNMVGTQADNARWFVQTTVWAFGSDLLQKIIYTEIEPPQDPSAFLQWMALTDTNGVPRQIYYAFKKLASLIDNYSSEQSLSLGTNIYGFQFDVNSTNVYVLWSKGGTGTHTNVALTGLAGTNATVIVSVPDINGTFQSYSAAISSGQVVFDALSEIPIYVIVNPELPAQVSSGVVSSDFDGDAKADPALFNTNGNWKIKLSSGGYSLLTLAGFLGDAGAAPVAADFDGDRLADPAVYYDSLELWAVKLSSLNYAAPTVITSFGGSGWQALAGDFDGDRLADPALYNTNGTWKVKLSTAGYVTVISEGLLGFAGWTAIAADFDGDGKVDPAIYRAGDGSWIVLMSRANYAIAILDPNFLGSTGYTGMAADFDADGYADPTVADVSTGNWKVKLSSGNYSLLDLQNFLGEQE
jgi:hypothetical protein